MSIKHIILFLIIFSFISCKREQQTNSFCKSDNFLKSHSNNVLNSSYIDKRRENIQKEEIAKDPKACKLKPEFEGDAMLIGHSDEEIYISWERCKALNERINKKWKALLPFKFKYWVMINGKRIKKSDLPLCSQCPKCNPITY